MLETLKSIDQTLFLAINSAHSPLADSFFWLVSEGWIFLPLWALVGYFIYKKTNVRVLITAIFTIIVIIVFCDQSSNIVKKSVRRYRPTHHHVIGEKVHTVNDYKGGEFGFFSSHAANTFGVATFLFFCLRSLKRKHSYLIFLWPAIVGYSRIYLGVHYPSDIAFGALDGFLWGFVFFKVFLVVLEKTGIRYA